MSRDQRHSKQVRKKIIVGIILILLIFLLMLIMIWSPKREVVYENKIYAGIGGCVKDKGVYQIHPDMSLYELIRKADGITKNADLSKLNLESKVVPWEVYCIPYKKITKLPANNIVSQKRTLVKLDLPKEKIDDRITIAYVGLPRTYIFITVYPKANEINVFHVPWFTAVANDNNEIFTLYDTYLRSGTRALVKSMQNLVHTKVDYYFVQDRKAWVSFIDNLGGIPVDVPRSFARQYHVDSGKHIVDGYTSWLYITFISKELRKIDFYTGSQNRIFRQKEFMRELFIKFRTMNFFDESKLAANIIQNAKTNININDASKIAKSVLKMKEINVNYLTLPGEFRKINGERYWDNIIDKYQQNKRQYKENILYDKF